MSASVKAPVLVVAERGRHDSVLEVYRGRQGTLRLSLGLNSGDYLDGMTRVGIQLTRRQVNHLREVLNALEAP